MILKTKSEAINAFGGFGASNFFTSAGMAVNYDSALQDTTIAACVRIIAQTIATLPLKLYKKTGQYWEEDTVSNLAHVLTVRPNVRQTSTEFVEQMVAQLALYSRFYAIPKRDSKNRVISLMPLNSPLQVSESELGDNIIYRVTTNDGRSIQMKNDEIFVVRDLSLNTYRALDKIHNARTAIGLSLAATKNAEQYYIQGPRAGGFIQVQKSLSEAAYTRMRNQFNSTMAGNENAHRLAILEEGAQFKENSYSLANAKVLESREAAIREIASVFGVPLPLLGVSDPNLKDADTVARFFYTSCLQSIISRIEDRFRLLIPSGYVLKFDTSEYLRGDPKQNVESTNALLTRGVISVNEARRRVGYQRITDKELFALDTNNLTFGAWDDLEKIQSRNSNQSPENSINKEVQNETTD